MSALGWTEPPEVRALYRTCDYAPCTEHARPGGQYCGRVCRDADRARVGMLTAALERARVRERRRRAFGIVDPRPVHVRLAERAHWGRLERERCLWMERADGYGDGWPERDGAARSAAPARRAA